MAQHKRPGYTAANERRARALARMGPKAPGREGTETNAARPPGRSWRGPRAARRIKL